MRKKIIAGNWKMNKGLEEGKTLANQIMEGIEEESSDIEIIIIPSFIHLASINSAIQGSQLKLGSQNCSQFEEGAYTGEVAAEMLKSVGVQYGLVGHSERRIYFNEDDDTLLRKIKTLLKSEIKVIYCCGESNEIRKKGVHFDEVEKQLNPLMQLNVEQIKSVSIAYEPVWAIGTGETASPEQAQEMHSFIRKLMGNKFSVAVAESISILYGGSVKPENAEMLFSKQDVDGGLIGGASLNTEDFLAIVNAM